MLEPFWAHLGASNVCSSFTIVCAIYILLKFITIWLLIALHVLGIGNKPCHTFDFVFCLLICHCQTFYCNCIADCVDFLHCLFAFCHILQCLPFCQLSPVVTISVFSRLSAYFFDLLNCSQSIRYAYYMTYFLYCQHFFINFVIFFTKFIFILHFIDFCPIFQHFLEQNANKQYK